MSNSFIAQPVNARLSIQLPSSTQFDEMPDHADEEAATGPKKSRPAHRAGCGNDSNPLILQQRFIEVYMPSVANQPARTLSFDSQPKLAERAVEILVQHSSSLLSLEREDAKALLPYLRLVLAPRGAALTAEGDQIHVGHLLLVLEGQVGVETLAGNAMIEVAVLGPGDLIGEVALLDGGPRSASCKAMTDVVAAALGRQSLKRLLEEHPRIAARLMAYVGQRVAEHLRSVHAQMQAYAGMVTQGQ